MTYVQVVEVEVVEVVVVEVVVVEVVVVAVVAVVVVNSRNRKHAGTIPYTMYNFGQGSVFYIICVYVVVCIT